jgi:hypothetical protein
MSVGLGWRGAILGIGKESTYGTGVTPTKFLCMNSDGLVVDEEKIEPGCINSRYRDEADVYQGNINPSGDFGTDVRFEGLEKLLENWFGSVVTTNPGTLAYNHQFLISDTLPSSLTLEKQLDSILATGKQITYAGCHINSMDFSIEPNAIMTASGNMIGKTATIGDSVTSPTLITEPHVLYNQIVVSLNSVDITKYISSLSLTMAKQLLEDRFRLGDRNRKEPVPNAKTEITGSISLEYIDKTLFDLFRNGTSVPLTVTFTGGLIEASQNYTFSFSMPKIKLLGGSPTISDESIIFQEIPFRAYATDSSTRELEINIKNKLVTV